MARMFGRTDDYSGRPMHCLVCTNPIPPTRKKDAITCSTECSAVRAKYLRSLIDQKRCRYCQRPSTPAERAAFNRWGKWEAKQAADAAIATQNEQPHLEGDTSELVSVANCQKTEVIDGGES